MDLAVVGIDGLDPDLVAKWRSDLPTLDRLLSSGASGQLRSTDPPLSSPAWPTLHTGKQGGKHGVYGFTQRSEGYEWTPVNYDDVKAESVWEALDAAGRSVGVVNVPVTYPPSDLDDGFVISGWPVPNRATVANPQSVLEGLERELGEPYQVNPFPLTVEFDQLSNDELFRHIRDGLRHHGEAFEYLLDEHTLDVFFGVFMAVDIASHNFAWDREYLRRIYVEQDEVLSDLLAQFPKNTNVVVVSDHGHAARGDKRFHVNEWLKENGYLATNSSNDVSLLQRVGLTQENYVRVCNALSLGDIHRRLPDSVFNKLKQWIPRADSEVGELDLTSIDWEETIAFSPDQNLLFLNRKDIYPNGTVDAEEASDVAKELGKELADLGHPENGDDLITHVATRDELFDGPYLKRAPDLVFVADDMRCKAAVSMDGEVFTDTQWGEHRQYGILIGHGPVFRDGVRSSESDITDVFPLLLGITDVPVPENVDGEVPQEFLTDELTVTFRESTDGDHPTRRYSDEEAEQVRDQLEGLGYLE